MKILIVHREFHEAGGIGSLYTALKKQFTIVTNHLEVGSRIDETHRLKKIIRLVRDYIRFFFEIRKGRYDIIHINPTLDFKSTIRDGLFIVMARPFCKKLIVHFHGWFPWFEQKIIGKRLRLFKRVYGRADVFIALSLHVKTKLSEWGFTQQIISIPNAFDVTMIEDFNFEEILEKRLNNTQKDILFLSRIHKEKGIFEMLQAMPGITEALPQARLIVGGDGEDFELVKQRAASMKKDSIVFLDYVKTDKKASTFSNASLYVLPSYSEGMPITVLEAMAFGLPVVVTRVGGIADFFENKKHGFMIEKAYPEEIAKAILLLLTDKELYASISRHNYRYAKDHFQSTIVAKKLEKLYKAVVRSQESEVNFKTEVRIQESEDRSKC
jgi:glycosyltransferase involved in cell wall biosynthesis